MAVVPSLQLSVVTTLYGSALHLREFVGRIGRSAAAVAESYEIVLVNDASPDDALAVALELLTTDRRVRVVDLAHNHGQYAALLAGLARCRGDRVFWIDCDLEEPPELLERFWTELQSDPGVDAVYGVQRRRRGGGRPEGWMGAAFYPALAFLSGLEVPRDTLVARLTTRRFNDALLSLPEVPWSLDALATRTGFAQKPVAVEKLRRSATTYSLRRRWALAAPALLAYGNRPLRGIVLAGVVAMGASAVLAAAAWRGWFPGLGRASGLALASVWLLGGGLLTAVGLVGLYVWLLLAEVRRHPALVRAEYGSD